jgi:hypothetical protein
MASAVSPSASAHVFATSCTIHAEKSCLRSRSSAATRSSRSARSAGGVRLHVLKASSARSTARRVSSWFAFWKRPTTSVLRAGFVLSNVRPVWMRSPPMTSG